MTAPRPACLAFAVLAALPAAAHAADSGQDCVIGPSMTVELGAPVEGVISEVVVDRGQHVHRGDVIALLESSVESEALKLAEAQATSTVEIEIAQSKVDLLQRQADRARTLAGRQFATASDLDTAEADLKTAKLELAQARENHVLAGLQRDRARALLDQRVIRSPIDGIMLRRLRGPGEYAYSQAQIAQIASIEPLYVDAFLPVALYPKVAVGDLETVLPAAPVGGSYEAKIGVIDQVFDAASDTFGVRLVLQNPGGRLPAGLDCRLILGPAD